jgi:hypothetical protein
MKHAAVIIICIILAFSGSAFALGKPDFTGTWTLDAIKSDMGQAGLNAMAARGKGRKVTLVIKQTPAILTSESVLDGRVVETAIFKLDGSESVNKSPSGQDIKSTYRWSGSTLVTKSIMVMKEGTSEMSAVRSLSADGKVMTIDLTRKTPRGDVKQKLIYNKQ